MSRRESDVADRAVRNHDGTGRLRATEKADAGGLPSGDVEIAEGDQIPAHDISEIDPGNIVGVAATRFGITHYLHVAHGDIARDVPGADGGEFDSLQSAGVYDRVDHVNIGDIAVGCIKPDAHLCAESAIGYLQAIGALNQQTILHVIG